MHNKSARSTESLTSLPGLGSRGTSPFPKLAELYDDTASSTLAKAVVTPSCLTWRELLLGVACIGSMTTGTALLCLSTAQT